MADVATNLMKKERKSPGYYWPVTLAMRGPPGKTNEAQHDIKVSYPLRLSGTVCVQVSTGVRAI